MVTYYIDFEGGNDANAGTSFATRWQTITNGATAARIAPGDEIRIMASPDPTSIGSATWTGGGRPAGISISSSTNATPIVVTTSSVHGLVTGDYVSISGHTTNTNANGVWRVGTTPTTTTFQILQIDGTNTTGNGVGGATGTASKVTNCMVKTASPLVQNIALCGGLGQKPAWTASIGVTTAQQTTSFKEGNSSAQIAIGAGFSTGKAAYYTLPATLNLSTYQQVSFWIQQTAGTIGAAGTVYVALCTDTLGDTVAHTCSVPNLVTTGVWVPITVDFGTNLNTAIRSVAFYVVIDNGAQTFLLDNIIACKSVFSANSVSLTSLVSKSDGTGDEAWYAIQSINSDAIMLANGNALTSQSASIRGYNGTTATVTSYKRETVKTTPVASSATAVSTINDSGTLGSLITFSGGWNRTDMSTQTGRTWLDGQNGNGTGLSVNNKPYVSIDRLDLCRYTQGAEIQNVNAGFSVPSMYITACTGGQGLNIFNGASGVTITNLWVNNCTAKNILLRGLGGTITTIKSAENSGDIGLDFNVGCQSWYVGSAIVGNCGASSVAFNTATNSSIGSATITNSVLSNGIYSGGFGCAINGGSTSGNLRGIQGASAGQLFLNNFTVNEATETTMAVASYVFSNRHDNTDNNSWIFTALGTVNQQTSVVDSPATTAWQMRPTTADATNLCPLALKIGTIVCAANSAVTVTARMRRTNTGLTMRLICPGGQITGVTNDVFSDMTAAANTWQTVTITFTPTKAGAVDIYAYAFGGTTFSGYVSNLTASQV